MQNFLPKSNHFNHSSQLNNVEQLNSVINDKHLVSLISDSKDVSSNITTSSLRWKEYQRLLSQGPELERIINLANKLDNYIHNSENFDEALVVLETISYLYKNYGHQVSLIESIHKEAERLREFLVASLCSQLEHLKGVSENEAISTVNHLARCGNFSDRELRLRYLQARDNWFNNECEDQNSSFDDIVRVYRNGLPMIFNEYKTVFGTTNEVLVDKSIKLSGTDPSKEDGAIINSWLLLKTTIFVASLEIYLKTMNQSSTQTPTMIGDTMQKCFELTDWLSSIGFDFSSQLRPLFYQALVGEIKMSIDKATTKFETTFTTTISKSIESLLLPVDDEILRISNMKPEEQIPRSIGDYPIFRVYCLYILDSLRWLQSTKKNLSPISLCLDTYSSLNTSLTRVMKALAITLNMDNNSKHPILSKIAISFITEVLPFIRDYCEKLFPEKSISSAVGLTKSEFKNIYVSQPEKLKDFRLDLKQIAEPLKSTMPALIQMIEI